MADGSHNEAIPLSSDTSNKFIFSRDHGGSLERIRHKRDPDVVKVDYREPVHTPWTVALESDVVEKGSRELGLHCEIMAYVAYILPTEQEACVRQLTASRLQTLARSRWYDANVAIFGSVVYNLCLPGSDIDLVMHTSRIFTDNDKKSALFQLRGMLQAARIADAVQVNSHARVPVVTFRTRENLGSVNVDISINSDGVQHIGIVRAYMDRMPALRPLVLVVKAFLSIRSLNSAATGGLSSYSIICMAISFLQLDPRNRPQECVDQPFEQKSLGTLLIDFFSYYGNEEADGGFPYSKSCISVSEGKLIPKKSKGWLVVNQPGLLSIQCLVNPDKDVSKGTGKIKQIKAAFLQAYRTLTSTPLKHILGSIVGLSQETLDWRARIRDLCDSGQLQQSLSSFGPSQSRSDPSNSRAHDNLGPSWNQGNHNSRRGNSGSSHGNSGSVHYPQDNSGLTKNHGKHGHKNRFHSSCGAFRSNVLDYDSFPRTSLLDGGFAELHESRRDDAPWKRRKTGL